jgi:hypothetical protein
VLRRHRLSFFSCLDLKTQARWGILMVSGFLERGVRFIAYPQDHEPRHVHGFIGSGEVIVDIRPDGAVALARRVDAVRGVTRSEVRKVLEAAERRYHDLVAHWENMHAE